MKKKIFIFLIIIVLILAGVFLFFKFKDKKTYKIDEKSKATIQMNISPEILYFAVSSPNGEWIISGIDDISEIKDKISIVTDSYTYSGDFNYNMILSGVNMAGIVQGNFLVNGNLIENGGRIIELDFNIENYLKKMIKQNRYENNHPEAEASNKEK